MDSIKLSKGLGWFSVGIGLAELLFGRRIAYSIGANQTPDLMRAFGARELAQGAAILSNPESSKGLWARVGGDVLDIAAVGFNAARPSNPKQTAAIAALGLLAVVLVVDVYAAQAVTRR